MGLKVKFNATRHPPARRTGDQTSISKQQLGGRTQVLEEPNAVKHANRVESEPQRPELHTSSSAPPKITDGEANTNPSTIRNEAGTEADFIPAIQVRSATIPTGQGNPPILTSLDISRLSPLSPLERTPSSPRSPAPSVVTEELTDDILPLNIPVKVTITWQGRRDGSECEQEKEISWTDKESYKELLPEKIINKHRDAYGDLAGKIVYHRHGSCRISASPELAAEMPYRVLDDAQAHTLVENVIPLICGFIHNHPCRRFSLEIYWDCGYADLKPQPNAGVDGNPTFHGMIKTELGKKRQKNFRDQDYISRRDQTVFQEYDVVHDLVILDNSLSLDPDPTEKFVHDIVQRPALKLLLICVFLSYNMKYLHHLLYVHGVTDDTPPRLHMDCTLYYCHDHVAEILRTKAMFYVRNVEPDFQYHTLESGEVMPLRPTLSNSELRSLGNGTSGNVFEVWIDPAHHYLTGDPLCFFAVKTFQADRKRQFEQEKQMLKVLADHPNQYIVPYITSWTQVGSHYILYPAATYNLRTYMQAVEPVKFTKDETLWFLQQLLGLASAIAHVHNLKNPTNSEPNPKEDAYWGRHNDIKPENILVFEKVPGSHPRFKIGDFGAGVFNAPARPGEQSRLTDETRGTLTYFAPDKDRNGTLSRPFDMWALGCVYLELMAWLFRFFESNEGGFSTARFNCTGADEKNRDDTFWDKATTPEGTVEYKLKKVVEDVMKELKVVWCKEMPAFQDILTAVTKLLDIDATGRCTAVQLKADMTQTVQQAASLLRDSAKFYSSQYSTNCEAERLRQQSEMLEDEEAVAEMGSASASAQDSGRTRATPSNRAAEGVIQTGTWVSG